MGSLEPLWDALEDSPRLVGVEQELRDALTGAYPIVEPFLAPNGRLAKRYPCPLPGDPGCPRRIVKESNDRFRAVCGAETSECSPLHLSRKGVEVLTFHAERFVRALQQALEMPANAPTIKHGGDLIELGVLRLDSRTRLTVVLLMSTRSSVHELLYEVIGTYRQGAVLLTPTDELIDGAMEGRLLESGFTWLVLADILIAAGEKLAAKLPLAKLVKAPTRATQRPPISEPAYRFPTPPDADWKDIHIRFTDGHTVTIKVRDVVRRVTYPEMNMKQANSGKPAVIWELLQSFAQSDGQLDWRNSDASRKIKQRVSRLRKTLKAYFGLTTDPFFGYQKGVGYRVRFHIEPER